MEGPEYLQTGFCSQSNNSDNNVTPPGSEHFIVEDLLDFSNDDDSLFTDTTFENQTGSSTDSSTLTCNSSSQPRFEPGFGFSDLNFSTDLYLPYDDLAELEWLSSFVEESFSTEDLEKLSLISGMNSRTDQAYKPGEFRPGTHGNNPVLPPDMSVPAKARSKRSRAAPCIWNSGISVVSPANSSSETDVFVTSHPNTGGKTVKSVVKKKENRDDPPLDGNGEGRKCLHCATDKTPQWRTGPMGPKTLCNACGVRYKSGRLVPEYRPASSPTFVLTKHSNSHRKVVELRRQKEFMKAQQQYLRRENTVFDVSNDDNDYLIHQQMGPEFG